MPSWSNEFKVGLLTIAAIGATVWGLDRTDDRPGGAATGFELTATFKEAEGVYPSTQARIAGVSVGSVREVVLADGRAQVRIEFDGGVKLPVDSTAVLKSEGVLGDRFVRVTPGVSDQMLAPGDTLQTSTGGADLEVLQAKLEAIADDVSVITKATRSFVENDDSRTEIQRTISNVDALVIELRALTSSSKTNIDLVAGNLANLTHGLDRLVQTAGPGLEEQMAQIKSTTARLDRTLADVEEITGKVNAGEGTLGALVNDRATIDAINTTLSEVNGVVADVGGVVGSVSGLQTEVYYKGAYLFGSDPDEPGFQSNPVAGASKNTLGLRIIPREEYWYQVELVSHPLDTFSYTRTVDSETGAETLSYAQEPGYRFSFQFARRWGHVVGRLGAKESSGGVGLDLLAAGDRLTLSADLFDFKWGSWPVLDGTPNLTLTGQLAPTKHVYLMGGLDNAIFGARHGYATGFVGVGFWFTDEDLKWVLAGLPFPG